MRALSGFAIAAGLVGIGALAGSFRPALSQDAGREVAGPVVGEVTAFKEKTKANGNQIYANPTTRTLLVTIVFEAGTDTATLSLMESSGRFTAQARATARTLDLQKAVSLQLAAGTSLWLKSDGGTARWQVLGAVPLD
jgi:hypothetical protein